MSVIDSHFELPDGTLRVVVSSGTGHIIGQPFTFPGRFTVLLDSGKWSGELLYCSASDLIDPSDTVKAWLAGFLCGCAPTYGAIYGRDDEDEYPGSEKFERWRSSVALLRREGWWKDIRQD